MKLVRYRKEAKYWQTEYRINGKRVRRRLPFTEASQGAEAKAFAKELYIKEYRGEIFNECKTTFREMTEAYLRDKVFKDGGKQYRLDVIYMFMGDERLDEITFKHYEALKKFLKDERGLKNQSINRYLADIRAILNLAVKQRIIKDFPPVLSLQSEKEREVRALTQEEQDTIYSVLPQYMKDPFRFAISSGWRKANLVGLKRRHLTKRPDGRYKVNFTADEMKRNKPFEHVCTQEETDIINRNLSIEHQYIFRRDERLNGAKTNHLGDFKKVILRARKDSGVFFTWHWLRHTCATNYAKMGVQEQTMNTLMSWSPKSRMAGNYSHLREEDFLADIRQQIENRGHKVGTKLNSSNLD